MEATIAPLLQALETGLYERSLEIRLVFLAMIAGENCFLLGPPGIAKSLIARRMKFALKDGKHFEYLMGRFSTPEEIFGPVSLRKLKEEDRYERNVEGYLPSAHVAFLDELWKASPAIHNTLLTIINEKVFRNGTQEIKVPLQLLIAASNELPPKGEGLEALWDRFLIRISMTNIQSDEAFEKMILQTFDPYQDPVPPSLKISLEQLQQWRQQLKTIEVPSAIIRIIHNIRQQINEYNQQHAKKAHRIYISDRRWQKIIKVLRASAFIHGRQEVNTEDCLIMPYMLWEYPEQIEPIRTIVHQSIRDQQRIKIFSLKEQQTKEVDFIEVAQHIVSPPRCAKVYTFSSYIMEWDKGQWGIYLQLIQGDIRHRIFIPEKYLIQGYDTELPPPFHFLEIYPDGTMRVGSGAIQLKQQPWKLYRLQGTNLYIDSEVFENLPIQKPTEVILWNIKKDNGIRPIKQLLEWQRCYYKAMVERIDALQLRYRIGSVMSHAYTNKVAPLEYTYRDKKDYLENLHKLRHYLEGFLTHTLPKWQERVLAHLIARYDSTDPLWQSIHKEVSQWLLQLDQYNAEVQHESSHPH